MVPQPPPPELIEFGDFRLDQRTLQLRHRGRERRLRAKSASVLLYLAKHPNRLVSRDEILRAIWPDTTVSPTVLRVCIREIRMALADEADRFLKTIPRRGYRFTIERSNHADGQPIFVGRAAERASLHQALASARSGRRQMVLVQGEAGAGKTALVDHFLDELRGNGEHHVARGQAIPLNADTTEDNGPLLEILSCLCNEAGGSQIVGTLARWAPGWLLQLPGRVDRSTAETLRDHTYGAGSDGGRLELREALEQIAGDRPLVLVLEDLHWAASSTIAALIYLMQSTLPAQILLIATCRTSEIPGNAPLAGAVRTLQPRGNCARLDLDPLSQEEIEAYLAQRFESCPPSEGTTRALSSASDGNPRRLAAIVDYILDRELGEIRDGAWHVDREDITTAAARENPPPQTRAPRNASPGRTICAERRQLTVLCCGLGDLPQNLDPEDLRNLLRDYLELASAVVRRHGGHVAQYTTDGLLAYFGYPVAQEDDARRAVRAAFELSSDLRRLSRPELARGISPVSSVGIHTGLVIVEDIGSDGRSEPLALGNVPHLAAAVQRAAEPGNIVVTDATKRLVGELFVMGDLGPTLVEGIEEPLRLLRVVRPTGARRRITAQPGRPTPFVGRSAELAELHEHWTAVQGGATRSVLLSGEAGIGKSRIVCEMRARLAGCAHTWLESGASPYATATAFHPIRDLIEQGLGLRRDDSTEAKLDKIERGLGTLSSAQHVALIAELLELSPAPSLRLSAELRRHFSIELLVEWMLAISAEKPAVIVVEDLHWCDPSTLELMARLTATSPTGRTLLLTTARPKTGAPWQASGHTATIDMTRLSNDETRAMAISLAGSQIDEATLETFTRRSDGVPLYIEELAKSISDSDSADPLIPISLADLLMARLDRAGGAKEVAQTAAVLGREFKYPMLAAVSSVGEATLRGELQRLVEADIVLVRGKPEEEAFAFKHALIQEAAYQSLLKETRRRHHARIAATLAASGEADGDVQPELIAHHYDQAGAAAQAISYYQRAGESAAERSAYEESIRHLRRALELIENLPDGRDRRRRELALLMAIAAPLSAARGWSNAEYEGILSRARELAATIDAAPELPRVIEGMAAATLMKGDIATSLEIANEVMTMAEKTGDTFDLLIGHVCVGTPLLFQGNYRAALEHLELGMTLYDPTDEPALGYLVGFDRGIAAHAYAGLCLVYLGETEAAVELSDRAVALARRLDHPLTLVNVLFEAAAIRFERREFDAMHEPLGELIGLAEELGFPFWLGGATLFRGALRVESGDIDTGIAEMQQAVDDLAKLGNGLGAPAALFVFANGLFKAGRNDEALLVVELALAQAAAQDQHLADAELLRLRAEILVDGGPAAMAEAETLLRRAVEVATQREAKLFALRAGISLGRLWERQGRGPEAYDLVARLRARLDQDPALPDLQRATEFLNEVGPPAHQDQESRRHRKILDEARDSDQQG